MEDDSYCARKLRKCSVSSEFKSNLVIFSSMTCIALIATATFTTDWFVRGRYHHGLFVRCTDQCFKLDGNNGLTAVPALMLVCFILLMYITLILTLGKSLRLNSHFRCAGIGLLLSACFTITAMAVFTVLTGADDKFPDRAHDGFGYSYVVGWMAGACQLPTGTACLVCNFGCDGDGAQGKRSFSTHTTSMNVRPTHTT